MSQTKSDRVALASGPAVAPATSVPAPHLLRVRDLSVEFRAGASWMNVVQGFDLDLAEGECVGLVGESGSGKTVAALAMLGLVQELGGRMTGSVSLGGVELTGLGRRELEQIRGRDVAMVFQQPARCLNPAFRVGSQIAEVVRRHDRRVGRKESWQRAVEALDSVGIPNAARRARDYPHQFSGGQAQRVMIAMALVCGPRVLIADEPTTALDTTVQARVLALLQEIQQNTGVGILLISHDLGVIASMCSRVVVAYAGQIVEVGTTDEIIGAPRHPYTRGLVTSVSDLGMAAASRVGASGERRRMHAVPGGIPSPLALPSGCRFHPRCSVMVEGACTTAPVTMRTNGASRAVRCITYDGAPEASSGAASEQGGPT
jgi:peptide/nickel transport system ATP-binding protein/oligopeptide transport system ATP-binding protein